MAKMSHWDINAVARFYDNARRSVDERESEGDMSFEIQVASSIVIACERDLLNKSLPFKAIVRRPLQNGKPSLPSTEALLPPNREHYVVVTACGASSSGAVAPRPEDGSRAADARRVRIRAAPCRAEAEQEEKRGLVRAPPPDDGPGLAQALGRAADQEAHPTAVLLEGPVLRRQQAGLDGVEGGEPEVGARRFFRTDTPCGGGQLDGQ